MANDSHSVFPVGKDGISASTFAYRHGLLPARVYLLCQRGRIIGARKHPLTKKWWIYPPAKLVVG